MVHFPSVTPCLWRSNGKCWIRRLGHRKQDFYLLCTIWGRNVMFFLKGEKKLKPLGKAVREYLCEESLIEKIMANLFWFLRPRRPCFLIFIALCFVPGWYRLYVPEVFAQLVWMVSWFPTSLGRAKYLEPFAEESLVVSGANFATLSHWGRHRAVQTVQ